MSGQDGLSSYLPFPSDESPERPVESELEEKATAGNFLINKLVAATGAFFSLSTIFFFLLLSIIGFGASNYFLVLLIIFLDLFLAVLAISVWRFARYFRGLSRRFWERHTDPSNFKEEDHLLLSIIPAIPKSPLRSYEAGMRRRFLMGFQQCFSAIVLLGIAGTALIAFDQSASMPNGEVHINNSVSVLPAFISV